MKVPQTIDLWKKQKNMNAICNFQPPLTCFEPRQLLIFAPPPTSVPRLPIWKTLANSAHNCSNLSCPHIEASKMTWKWWYFGKSSRVEFVPVCGKWCAELGSDDCRVARQEAAFYLPLPPHTILLLLTLKLPTHQGVQLAPTASNLFWGESCQERNF